MKRAQYLHLLDTMVLASAKVSETSGYDDPVWWFSNPTAGQDRNVSSIRWDFEMPDQTKFTDEKWSDLRDAFKRFALSLFESPQTGKNYKAAMWKPIYKGIRYFARWMATKGYVNFGELDADAFDEYAADVFADKSIRKDNAEITAWFLTDYFRLPYVLFFQSPCLREVGIPVPSVRPWGGVSPFVKAKTLARNFRGQIPPMPDDVFLRATTTALDILDGSPEFLAEVHAFKIDRPESRAARRARRKSGRSDSAQSSRLIKRTRRLRNACLVLVQGLTGMRASEVCGLTVDRQSVAEWPSCVTVRPSSSGLHEIFYVSGRLFKTTKAAENVEWVAGSRPVGTAYIPIPIRAIIAMEKLFRFEREARGNQALFVQHVAARWLSRDVSAMSAADINYSQEKHFELAGIANWPVSSHQWRKTFAQYVIRTDNKMLPVLRDHFKHLSIAMTEEGYVNADPELKQLIDDMGVNESIQTISNIITGKERSFGPLAEELRKGAQALGKRLSNREESDKAGDVEELVRSAGLRVWEVRSGARAFGRCLFRQGTGNCTEGCSARYMLRAPLWSAARPDLCWDCKNLIRNDSHADFWKDRLASLRSELALAREDRNTALEMLCRERITQCVVTLNSMGVKTDEVANAE